jgi:Rieske 2Fe-2S family protein
MIKLSDADIARLVAERQPGHTLQAPFYVSPEIFDLDLELIFSRHWIFVATEPEIAEPGDYVTVQIGRSSVAIIRDDDMEVRAFHNVCRHRGSKVLLEQRGFTGNLVCPYHQWTYDLTGKLLHAENMPQCFDRSEHSLKPVALRNVGGILFICLADHPPTDFDEFAHEFEPYIAPHHLRDCKVAKQIDVIEHGNWKLTIENNRECYHCGGHPELGRSLFTFFGNDEANESLPRQREYFERYQRTHREFKGIWDNLGLPWQTIEKLHGRDLGWRTERLPLDGPGESYTMDAKAACKRLMNGFTSPRLGALHLHTQPNSWHHYLGDHAVTFSTLPVAPDKTIVRTTWLVHKDAVEGQDYDIDNLTHVWNKTNEQDATFVSWAHAGLQSPAYRPGPFARSEYMCDDFCTWYIERLSAALNS